MSEETKFKVYVSYLKDEAPTDKLEELLTGLRSIVGEDGVFLSDPSLSVKDLFTKVPQCQVLVHIVTPSSYWTRPLGLEVRFARRANRIVVAYYPLKVSLPIELDSAVRSLPDILMLVAGLADQSKRGSEFEALEKLREGKDSPDKRLIDQALREIKDDQSRRAEKRRRQDFARLKELSEQWFTALGRRRLDEAREIFEQAQLIWEDQPSEELRERLFILRPEALSLLEAMRDAEFWQRERDYDATNYELRTALDISSRFSLLPLEHIIRQMLDENDHHAAQIRRTQQIYEEALRLIQGDELEAAWNLVQNIDRVTMFEAGHRFWNLHETLRKINEVERDLNEIERERRITLSADVSRLRKVEAELNQRRQALIERILSFISATSQSKSPSNLGSSKTPVIFTLYNPTQVCKQTRYSLITYAHKPGQQSAVKQDARKFNDELSEVPKERHSAEPIPIAPKTEITIVPEAEGITFDPAELTKTWDEKWLRFNFDFEVPDNYPDEEILLRVSVQVRGFEVACIKSSCEVVAEAVAETVSVLPDDPLVDPPKESGTRKADAHLYRNVFLSYSHKDEEIAWRRARQIEQALGDRVFMDVKDLRAGEDWESRLFEAIDKADILHLLWSENSAQSDFCRREWTYALEKKCGDTRCFGVIRPVYWQKPMPTPPPELAHLHFQQIKLEDE